MIKKMTLFEHLKEMMFRAYSGDGGKILIHMGALGWIFSSLAQLVVVAKDPNIDKKKKKFLLPQEFADGVVNVGLYYSICELIKGGTDYLVKKGHLIGSKVVDNLMKVKPKHLTHISKNEWRKLFTAEELQDLSKTFKNIRNLNMFKNITIEEAASIKEDCAKIVQDYGKFKNGMGVFAAVFASVLACNVITPYVRNKIANKAQKELLEKEAWDNREKLFVNNITTKNTLPKPFSQFNNFNGYRNLKI